MLQIYEQMKCNKFEEYKFQNFISDLMGLKKYVKMLDLGFMPNPVIINGEVAYRSYYCSLVSIIALVFFLFYCVGKVYMASNISRNYEEYLTGEVQFSAKKLQFYALVILEEKTTRDHTYIHEDNMFEQGLTVQLCVNSTGRPENCSTLRTDNITGLLFEIPEGFDFYVQQKQNKATFFQVKIKYCDPKENPRCHPMQESEDKKLVVSHTIAFLSDTFSLTPKNQQQEDFCYDSDIMDSFKLRNPAAFTRLIYSLHKFVVYNDQSIWPWVSPKKIHDSWYYEVGSRKEERQDDQIVQNYGQIIKSFRFKADPTYLTNKFQVEKVDSLLPKLFTVFSLLMAAIRISSSHYRRWSLKIEAAKTLFEDKEEQLLEPNLMNYIKSMIGMIKKERSAKITEKKAAKAAQKLDYVLMAKKIDDLTNLLRQVGRTKDLSILDSSKFLQDRSSDESQDEEFNQGSVYRSSNAPKPRDDKKYEPYSDQVSKQSLMSSQRNDRN